jgi:hypothetical protein
MRIEVLEAPCGGVLVVVVIRRAPGGYMEGILGIVEK